ncbi:MAG: YceI family protein [Bacteroidota bacterium]
MKLKQLLLFVLCLISLIGSAQNYLPVERASSIKFYINNFGFSTEGSFNGLRGEIYFNPSNLEKSSFEVSVNAASVFTKNRNRDTHLKSLDYFYVDKYPTIYLISKMISKSDQEGFYWFQGNLIIKGVTKEVKFLFSAVQERSGYLFNGNLNINRRDFLVGSGSLVLSNNVQVSINVSTMKK